MKLRSCKAFKSAFNSSVSSTLGISPQALPVVASLSSLLSFYFSLILLSGPISAWTPPFAKIDLLNKAFAFAIACSSAVTESAAMSRLLEF
jgi:hypothetical protein